jgi:hypothetical protein
MSKKYPYALDNPYSVCQSPIVITRKRKKIPHCYNSTIQKHPKIITKRTCPKCSKVFDHHKNIFCSKKCSNQYKAKPAVPKFNTCLYCQKEYQLKKDLGNYYSKYCSCYCFTQAKIAKYKIDLSNISDAYLLGQIWSSVLVKDLLEIRFYSSQEVLKSILLKLSASYPIKKTRSEVYNNYFKTTHTVKIFNRELISKLLDLGLESPIYRTWPLIKETDDLQFINGYCDSVKKIIKDDEIWFWMISKDMARAVEDKFSGQILYIEGDWWWIRSRYVYS